MFREIIEEVKNMNKEQETLQKEQADLKENRVSLPDMKNIITEIPKLLERLNSKLTSDVEGKCHLKSEEIQNIVEPEGEGRRKKNRSIISNFVTTIDYFSWISPEPTEGMCMMCVSTSYLSNKRWEHIFTFSSIVHSSANL